MAILGTDRIGRLVLVLGRAGIVTVAREGHVHIANRAWFVGLARELLEALEKEPAPGAP